jgi:hypothetical protein
MRGLQLARNRLGSIRVIDTQYLFCYTPRAFELRPHGKSLGNRVQLR